MQHATAKTRYTRETVQDVMSFDRSFPKRLAWFAKLQNKGRENDESLRALFTQSTGPCGLGPCKRSQTNYLSSLNWLQAVAKKKCR